MMWFTADLHFGHSSILSKMNRPFETLERMNQGLIAAINERVAPSDSLYVLGDFAYQTTAENARRLREQIACEHVHLIRGNHDDSWSTGAGAGIFETEQDYLEIAPGYARGHKLVLFHYPIMSWNGKRRDAIALHGHVHSKGPTNNERNRERGILRYDVGVDANSYAPVSLTEVLKFFEGAQSHSRMGQEGTERTSDATSTTGDPAA